MTYDLVIRNGRIVDGIGTPAYRGDIGIKGDEIVAMGEVASSGSTDIDAAGVALWVAARVTAPPYRLSSRPCHRARSSAGMRKVAG